MMERYAIEVMKVTVHVVYTEERQITLMRAQTNETTRLFTSRLLA